MKLKKDFITHESNGEVMLVATGKAKFSGLVRGNKMLGEILTMLKTNTTEERIVKSLRAKYDAPAGKVESDVHSVLMKLRKIGAIEEKR
ncbi:MAG: PqqD family protein [Ruminococcus sp.]|nr:PqqD family protein [Ruminococcus sp.]